MKLLSLGRLGQRLQGQYILPVARILYLGAAALCLIAVIGGLGFTLIFQLQTFQSPDQELVPDVAGSPDVPLDIGTINAHLVPPSSITASAYQGLIFEPLTPESILATFSAVTPNGLASFPDDILILGGTDAAMFERSGFQFNNGERTVLSPASTFIRALNQELPTLTTQITRQYVLRIAARDIYGNLSDPADVTLTLTFGPAPPIGAATTPSTAPVVSQAQNPAPSLTAYQTVARDIALIVDPNRTPAYFEAYQRALLVPQECGADENNPEFASDARNAFEQTKVRLLATNVEAFHAGLCAAWQISQQEEQAARAQANAERQATISRNALARSEAEAKAFGASVLRNLSLGLVGGAIMVFLIIALLLAVLAIENHSKVMRETMEAMMNTKPEGDLP